jgi:hypothetical protein
MGRERAWRRDGASDGDVGAAPGVKAMRAGRSKEGNESAGKRDSGRELPPRLSGTAQVL